jgi:hypothetical protein
MDTRKLIDFSMEDNGVEFRNQLYASIHDRVTAAIEAKKQEIAQNLVTQESLEKMDSKNEPEDDEPGEMKDARRKDSKKKDQSTNKSGQEMNEEDSLHPMASQVLKHIKPEHHDVYKPHLSKGTFNGSYADRRDVLKAAENAGHMKESLDKMDSKRDPEDDKPGEMHDSNRKKSSFPSAKGPSQSGAGEKKSSSGGKTTETKYGVRHSSGDRY